jgi:hypothetical protein
MFVFVVEDSPNDLSLAVKTAGSAGFTEIEARSSLESAQSWLEKRLQDALPVPIAIVVDLDLGPDSDNTKQTNLAKFGASASASHAWKQVCG